MRPNFQKLGTLLMLFALVATMFLSSCKKEDVGTPPDIPPEGAFVMDYDTFNDSEKSVEGTESAWNFAHAVTRVAFWNVILTGTMAIPVASYVEALKHEPVHHSGTTWLWEYEVKALFATYTAQLYGTKEDDKVVWEMYVSKNGDDNFQEFLWYKGENNLDRTSGKWTLYKSVDDPTEFLQIDWTRNVADSTGTLKYTNIVPGGAENGGYIYYGNDQDGELNAFYDIYNKGEDNLTEIEWNTTTKAGHIKGEHIFSDTEWHCWDENFQDIDCAEPTK